MDQRLLKKARFNSALLALQFGIMTVTGSGSVPVWMTVIGAIATLITISDVYNLHSALNTPQETKGE